MITVRDASPGKRVPMLLKMMKLETERLLLREFQPGDLTRVADWESAAHAERFLEFCIQSYREWGMGPWALVLKETNAIVGNCGFCRIRYERTGDLLEYCGEFNYYVGPKYRGQGFATEALRVIVKFGFEDLKLTRIQGRCAAGNVGSERVMLKAGLKFEKSIAGVQIGSTEEKLYCIPRESFQTMTRVPNGMTGDQS